MTHGESVVKDPEPGWSKAHWRRWGRARRAELDLSELSERIAAVLGAWLDAQPPTTVLLYRAMAGEIGLDRLAEAAGSDGRHRWATTRTPPAGPLTLHPWDSPLERHRFGYDQPVADASVVEDSSIGIVVVPGLVFDRAGRRIGYGKGYYDRLLARLGTVPDAVLAVGVAPTASVVDRLPVEAHDRTMTLLATESGMTPVTR